MEIKMAIISEIGLARNINEDNFYFLGSINDYKETKTFITYEGEINETSLAVFDGMGGMNNGQQASLLAASEFSKVVLSGSLIMVKQKIFDYYINTNNIMCDVMARNRMSRMGTTATTLTFVDDSVLYSNIGDSRLYLIRDNVLTQLSQDHSEVGFLIKEGFISEEEAINHPSSNRLTQHLGVLLDEFIIEPYINKIEYRNNDIFILATDGLTNYCSKKEILDYCTTNDIIDASEKMKLKVMENGAQDNFTFIISKVAL